MRLRRTLALLSIAVLSLTGCSTQTDVGAPDTGASVTQAPASVTPSSSPKTIAMVEAPVSAVLGTPVELDRTVYGGTPNGGCVLGPDKTMICTDLSATGADFLNAIIGQDQLRNPQSLAKNPPVPVEGLPVNPSTERLDRVLATAQGYLLVVRNNEDTPSTNLTHVSAAGEKLWMRILLGSEPRDIAVTAQEVLLSYEGGVKSLNLSDGKAGTTAAPAGTLLAGSTPGRDGYSSYGVGTTGLAKSSGGTVLTLASVPAASALSCTDSTDTSPTCYRVEELYADSDYLVVANSSVAKSQTVAYNSAGTELWTVSEPVTSAVRYGETFVLGYAGETRAKDAKGRLAVVAADSGKEIGGTAKPLASGSFYIAGATEDGVIYGIDGDSISGAYDLAYAVMPITVTTGKVPAADSASAESSASAQAAGVEGDGKIKGWKTEKSASGAFTFQTPASWLVERTESPMGNTTKVTEPSSGITLNVLEGLNGIGGACAPSNGGLNEGLTVLDQPVAGMHVVSSPIGKRTPSLEVTQEGMYFIYSINRNDAKPACAATADLFNWPGVGTMRISAQVSAKDLDAAKISMAEYPRSSVHRNLVKVMASFAAVK